LAKISYRQVWSHIGKEITMSEHTSVSSEEFEEMEAEVELHEAVSSEELLPEEAEEVLEKDDFEGVAEAILEQVEGFDESYALIEGELALAAEISVTEALEALPQCCEVEFEAPESVCGRDDRVRISPATRIPWRWNCQLIITMANGGRSRCTGFFIGPRAVMTAGHCVYSRAAGGWARSIQVIPGKDGASEPFGSQVATSFRSVVGWTRGHDNRYDYGCIILPNRALGNRVGYFGFAALSSSSLRGLLVNNAGYAGDKPFGTLWYNAGRITRVTARRIEYMIDTYGGHSGSPVWLYRSGHRYVVGIHGYGGCPNKAVRVVRPVYNNMLAWRRL
jgi:V8-like Glu-specific endopeptidase